MAEEGDKRHEATPYRREQARKEGQVAKSQDLAAALVLLAASGLLMTFGRTIAELFANFTRLSLREQVFLVPVNTENDGLFNSVIAHYYGVTIQFLGPMSLFFGALLLVAIGANLGQVGFLWLPKKLAFNFSHLNPVKGFGRIFSTQSVMRLVMGIVKIVICAVVAYYALYGEIERILGMTNLEVQEIASYLSKTLLLIAMKVAVALVIIAILDFMYQKWKHNKDLRMTTEELKQEFKNREGDPQILQKRKQVQRELAMKQRSVQGTADADVVVTNPTHLAVALKFDPATMQVPIVVAKGADFLAKTIREIAAANDIPIIEKKPLAQSLYRTVEINDPILEEHYGAVVEILRFVYQLKGKKIA
jgi:flagellar biosynthetic protein FlhB